MCSILSCANYNGQLWPKLYDNNDDDDQLFQNKFSDSELYKAFTFLFPPVLTGFGWRTDSGTSPMLVKSSLTVRPAWACFRCYNVVCLLACLVGSPRFSLYIYPQTQGTMV